MNITIVRHAYLPSATLGTLHVGDERFAVIADTWRPDPDGPGGQRLEGKLLESCVPDGVYKLVPHDSEKFGDVWAMVNPVLGVYRWPGDIPNGQPWGRSACLFHAGNTTDNSIGCEIIGTNHGTWGGRHVVTDSAKAIEKLRGLLGRKEHTLTIRPSLGTLEMP